MSKEIQRPWVLIGLVVGVLCSAGATAQSAQTAQAPVPSTGGLEEVVVTSQRREERLQDVPISVSAISQDKMDSQGLRSIDDVTQLTPGITFQRDGLSSASNYNDENSDISIRGIESSAGTSTTGIYLDDTPIQTRHLGYGSVNAFPVLFDLERVEVLRGPQGTLFGAGSEGGTVRFVTPEPSVSTYSGYMRSELGSTYRGDTSYEAGAAVGGPLIDGTVGVRASAYYRRDGGYVDREDYLTGQITQPNANWQNTANVRVALKWVASDTLSITPSFFYQRLHLNDTAAYWPELSNRSAGVFRNGNRQTDSSTDPFYLAAVKLDWDLSWAHLTADSSYFSRRQYTQSDYTQFDRTVFGLPPRPPAGSMGQSPFQDTQDNTVLEARLQSTDRDARITWTTGLFFAHLDENDPQSIIDPNLNTEYTAAYGVPLCTAAAPCPGGQIVNGPENRIIDRQVAAYGEMSFKFSDRWSATTGLRVSRAEYSGRAVAYGPFISSTLGPTNPLITDASATTTPVTPRVVLTYHPDRNNLFYTSASKGYRVGGVNQSLPGFCGASLAAIGLSKVPDTYSPDSLWSYEVGAKNTLLDHRLQIDSSLFLIDWKGIQQAIYLPACGEGFVANEGRVRSQGGDIDIEARPIDVLLIGFTAAYTDAKYTGTVCGGGVDCTSLGYVAMPIVSRGDHLPGAPWTFTLSGEYSLPHVGDREPYVHFDYHYATAQTALLPTQNSNNAVSDPTLPGLPLVRSLAMRAGLRWNGMDVSVYGQNLTNEHPLLFLSRDTTASDLYFARSVRPRTLGVTVTYRFQ